MHVQTKHTATKVALITGGSRGLGKNTAANLALQGVDIVITYLSNKTEAEETIATIEKLGRKAVALQLNVADITSFENFRTNFKELLEGTWCRSDFDYLVNNAGSHRPAPIGEISENDFDTLYNTHLKGTLFLIQTLLPLIIDGGRIVNISSGLTRFVGNGSAAYASMKGAVEVLTRYMAKELGPRGITVNVVAPGAIETDFGSGTVRDNPAVNKAIATNTALRRTGVPDDIGPMIASLLSDANRWVTGQRIEVSGGMFL